MNSATVVPGGLSLFAPVGEGARVFISCVRDDWQYISDGKWIGWLPATQHHQDSGTCPVAVESAIREFCAAVEALPEDAWESGPVLPQVGPRCQDCLGTGVCGSCGGTGQVTCNLGERHDCTECVPGDDRCWRCLGTGLSESDEANVLVCGMDASLPRISLLVQRGAKFAAVHVTAADQQDKTQCPGVFRRPGFAIAFVLADGIKGILMPKTKK